MANDPHTPSHTPEESRRGVRRTPAAPGDIHVSGDVRIPSEAPTAPSDPLTCPFCHSTEVEEMAAFGAQLMTEQYYCRACRTPFERIKDNGDRAME